MSRVLLGTSKETAKLVDLLAKSVDSYFEDHAVGEHEYAKMLAQQLRELPEHISGPLEHLTAVAASDVDAGPAAATSSSKPLSADALKLEQEIQDIARRLVERRQSLPSRLAQMVAEGMEALRPRAEALSDLLDAEAPGAPAEAGCAPAEGPSEIKARFAGVSGKLPGLRTRLERVVQRLERSLAAVEAERGARKPPSEGGASRQEPRRASFNPLASPPAQARAATDDDPRTPPTRGAEPKRARDAQLSPAFQEAMESGRITTRKRSRTSPPGP